MLINMGSIIDLPSEEWFGDFPDHLRVHIIDSNRPQNLASLFGPDEKIVIWDDGGAEDLEEENKAWEALAYAPDDDEDSDSEEDEDETDDIYGGTSCNIVVLLPWCSTVQTTRGCSTSAGRAQNASA